MLKQDMAKSFQDNPSPIYKEHYIKKLASLGYDKAALDKYATFLEKQPSLDNKNINLSPQVEPENSPQYEASQAEIRSGNYDLIKEQRIEQGGLMKALQVVPDTFMNSLTGVAKGAEQINRGFNILGTKMIESKGEYAKTPLSTKLKDIGTGMLDASAGALKTGLSAASFVQPELAAFNVASGEVEALPDEAKAKMSQYLFNEGMPIGTEKERARQFDTAINFPFAAATTIADHLGYKPDEGSAGKAILDIANVLFVVAAAKGGSEAKNIMTPTDYTNAMNELGKSGGVASPEQLQKFADTNNAIKNVTLDDVKQAIEKNVLPQDQHDLHDKLAELQAKIQDASFNTLPVEVQDGIFNDIKSTQNAIKIKAGEDMMNTSASANQEAKAKEIDEKIEQAKQSQEGQSDAVKQSIQNTIDNLTQEKNAIQIGSAAQILQREQSKIEQTGSERGGMEQSEQGAKTPTKSKEEIINDIIHDSIGKGDIEPNSEQEKIARESLSKRFDNQKELNDAIGLSFKAQKGDLAETFLDKGNPKPQEYVYKTPKNEYKVENGGLQGLVIKGKEGKPPSENTRLKITKDYEQNFDYTKGKSAFEGIEPGDINESEADKLISEKSENPNEIIEAHERLLADDEHVQGNATEHLISENIGKVKQKGAGGYNNFGDPNNVSQGKARAYFSEQKGEDIDTLAQRLSEEAGHEVTPQDIVDFIDKYPNGISDYNKSLKNPLIKELSDRFKKVTGLTLNDRVKENALSPKDKEYLNLEHRNYEQFHKGYLDSYEKGGFNEPANETGENRIDSQSQEGEKIEKVTLPNDVGVSEEMRDRQRKELGLDELPKVEKRTSHTDEYLNSEANRLVESKEVDPIKLAESILNDGVVTDDIGIAVLNHGAVELGNKIVEAKDRVNEARSIGDKIADEKASDEYLQYLSDLNNIHKALEKEGSKAGQKLRSFQTSMKEDFSVGGLYSRFKKANGDKPIPSELIDRLDTYSAQIQELNIKIKDAEDIIAKQGKSIEDLQNSKTSTKEKIAKVREKRSELFNDWKKYRNGGNNIVKNSPLPIGDEDIKFIAKIALNYLEEGLLTTTQVAKKLKAEVKKHMGIKISDDDLAKVLDTEIDGKKVVDNFDHTELQKKLEENKIKREKIKRKVNNEESAIEFANRSTSAKIKEGVSNVMNVPRSLMASFDFSAPLRQGLVATVAHPSSALKATGEMFKQFASAKNFEDWLIKYKASPDYELAKKSELYVADPSELHLDGREEAFMSNLAEKIPLVKYGIVMSERAYVGYLNKLRTDVFKNMADQVSGQGKTFETHPEEFKALADFVNSTTGRGKLPNKTIEDAAPLLNSMFFSPRLIASRINLLNPIYYAKMPPKVRIMAIKDMAKFAGVATTILALAKLSGAQVEDDARSTDFGKIKVGDTRYDVLGGFQQYIRLAGQMITGEKKTAKGIMSLTKPNFQGQSRGSELLKFTRNKLSPAAGMGVDFLSGVDATGQPVTAKNELYTHLTPLQFQDGLQAYQLGGMAKVLSVMIPSIFGVGVQTYNNSKSDNRKRKEFLKLSR